MNEFIGVIAKVVDKDLYKIEVDIPGYGKMLPAFPTRGEVDEPRVGDIVLLKELDSHYRSLYIYKKLKENDFIGIRSRGKKVWIKEDFIQIGIFPPDDNNSQEASEFPDTVKGEWFDDNSGKDPTPECSSWIKVDKDGNLDIEMEGQGKIHITSNHEVKINGNLKVEIGGNAEIKVGGNASLETKSCDVKASGSCTIDSPDVKVTGASMTVAGTAPPSGSGPFNCLKACIFSGCIHSSDRSLNN